MSTACNPIKVSDQSLWPVLLVVNEIARRKRFSLENLILGGMWPGPTKPSAFTDVLVFRHHYFTATSIRTRPHIYIAFEWRRSQVQVHKNLFNCVPAVTNLRSVWSNPSRSPPPSSAVVAVRSRVSPSSFWLGETAFHCIPGLILIEFLRNFLAWMMKILREHISPFLMSSIASWTSWGSFGKYLATFEASWEPIENRIYRI